MGDKYPTSLSFCLFVPPIDSHWLRLAGAQGHPTEVSLWGPGQAEEGPQPSPCLGPPAQAPSASPGVKTARDTGSSQDSAPAVSSLCYSPRDETLHSDSVSPLCPRKEPGANTECGVGGIDWTSLLSWEGCSGDLQAQPPPRLNSATPAHRPPPLLAHLSLQLQPRNLHSTR